MQGLGQPALGQQPAKGPGGAHISYERHRPEESTLYRLVQQHAATFFAQVEATTGAALPELITPVLQVVQRVLARYLLGQAGMKAGEGDCGSVTLIQRFGSAANLNIHLHCLVLDGVYQTNAKGEPE